MSTIAAKDGKTETPPPQNGLKEKITAWGLENIDLVFAVLRWVRPNVTFNGTALVTRFDDVQEVLSHDWVFGVPYEQKMLKVTGSSNFFLGMENTSDYARDVSNMRLAVRREDMNDKVIPIVDKKCEQNIKSIQGDSFDAVQDISLPVATQFIGDYFGTPGWNEKEFANAATEMFHYLFYPDDPELETRALTAAKLTREYLDDVIAERKNEDEQVDDILGRCLAMQKAGLPGLTDLDIRNNLIGLIIGAIPTTSKCAILTLDYLLDHEDLFAAAKKAADENDIELLKKFVLESIRLSPFAAGVQRICLQDYTVARGNLRASKIKKGTKVLAATQSAMQDMRKVKKPKEFRLDRPDHTYMHFGFGLHTCFGQYINMEQIPRIVKALLCLPGLQRVNGDSGKVKYYGPFPQNLQLSIKS